MAVIYWDDFTVLFVQWITTLVKQSSCLVHIETYCMCIRLCRHIQVIKRNRTAYGDPSELNMQAVGWEGCCLPDMGEYSKLSTTHCPSQVCVQKAHLSFLIAGVLDSWLPWKPYTWALCDCAAVCVLLRAHRLNRGWQCFSWRASSQSRVCSAFN